MEGSEGHTEAGRRAGQEALRELEAVAPAERNERDRRRGAGRRAEDHAVGRLALFSRQPHVERGDGEHDAGGHGIGPGEAEDHAGGDSSGQRRPPGAPDAGVERLEPAGARQDEEEREGGQECESGFGHSRSSSLP